jgi:hypothetical protein
MANPITPEYIYELTSYLLQIDDFELRIAIPGRYLSNISQINSILLTTFPSPIVDKIKNNLLSLTARLFSIYHWFPDVENTKENSLESFRPIIERIQSLCLTGFKTISENKYPENPDDDPKSPDDDPEILAIIGQLDNLSLPRK